MRILALRQALRNEERRVLQLIDDNAVLRKHNAEMRAAIDHVIAVTEYPNLNGEALSALNRNLLRDSLQPDAGSDLLTREQVRPLVDALVCANQDVVAARSLVLRALVHAKSLGL